MGVDSLKLKNSIIADDKLYSAEELVNDYKLVNLMEEYGDGKYRTSYIVGGYENILFLNGKLYELNDQIVKGFKGDVWRYINNEIYLFNMGGSLLSTLHFIINEQKSFKEFNCDFNNSFIKTLSVSQNQKNEYDKKYLNFEEYKKADENINFVYKKPYLFEGNKYEVKNFFHKDYSGFCDEIYFNNSESLIRYLKNTAGNENLCINFMKVPKDMVSEMIRKDDFSKILVNEDRDIERISQINAIKNSYTYMDKFLKDHIYKHPDFNDEAFEGAWYSLGLPDGYNPDVYDDINSMEYYPDIKDEFVKICNHYGFKYEENKLLNISTINSKKNNLNVFDMNYKKK